jgi:hypothetical protein
LEQPFINSLWNYDYNKIICIDICFRIFRSRVVNFKAYNPFDLSRSAGVGLRVFMPAFGLLGIGLMSSGQKPNQMDGNPFHYWTTILKKLNHDFLIL